MSSPEVQRLQDVVTFISATGRNVNTRNGPKTVWDCKTQDGRTFQSWDQGLAQQAQNLVGQQVQVIYKETPSRDPQYPPNLQLETITPMGLQGPGAAAAPMQPAPMAAQPAPTPMGAAPMQPAQTAPLPASHGTPGAGTGSGPSQEDKASMRRSAAVKAASYLAASLGGDDPETDFWLLAEQVLTYIETGNDPFRSSQSAQAGQAAPNEFPPGF